MYKKVALTTFNEFMNYKHQLMSRSITIPSSKDNNKHHFMYKKVALTTFNDCTMQQSHRSHLYRPSLVLSNIWCWCKVQHKQRIINQGTDASIKTITRIGLDEKTELTYNKICWSVMWRGRCMSSIIDYCQHNELQNITIRYDW